jgi:regulator of protease activity HflC (stomatin/prohibitin superfamily)
MEDNMKLFQKIHSSEQPQAKIARRLARPDINLVLIRLIILLIPVALLSAFASPSFLLDPAEFSWRFSIFCAALVLVFSIRKAREWERAIVLRLGKFHKVKGPGFFFLFPLLDQVHKIIDVRVRITDFYAQETLTGDSVTVDVDAFCFWLVWDPQKAALEVEDYEEAVVLVSKAVLRNVISKNDLTTFLARGDIIEKQIQEEVEKQTTEWGITVHYIEISEIKIPQELQNSLSRVAQAEREKRGRILLAEAEIEIAKKLENAMAIYAKDEGALKLRILSILNEGLKTGNSMMLVPNSITDELKTKDIFGLQALNEIKKKNEGSGSSPEKK